MVTKRSVYVALAVIFGATALASCTTYQQSISGSDLYGSPTELQKLGALFAHADPDAREAFYKQNCSAGFNAEGSGDNFSSTDGKNSIKITKCTRAVVMAAVDECVFQGVSDNFFDKYATSTFLGAGAVAGAAAAGATLFKASGQATTIATIAGAGAALFAGGQKALPSSSQITISNLTDAAVQYLAINNPSDDPPNKESDPTKSPPLLAEYGHLHDAILSACPNSVL